MDSLTLSQSNLMAFVTCRRRFYLRYLEKLPWPFSPQEPQQASAIYRGRNFHILLEQFLLGLPLDEHEISDRILLMWWRQFERNVLPLPEGLSLPELGLTIPLGRHFLTGRFDLLIISRGEDQSSINIYDWKTSRPRSTAELRDEWQSKLYMAMAAESNGALAHGRWKICVDKIKLTYWYVDDPQTPRTLTYSEEQHKQNWDEIQQLVAEVDYCLENSQWPLTNNWRHCRSCGYASYCGRLENSKAAGILAEDRIPYEVDSVPFLEPESP